MTSCVIAGLAACLTGGSALAQAPEQPATQPAAREGAPPGNELTLQPVIVTAQRQEADVQSVPQSITVLGRETIRDAQIENVRDASLRVPNLTLQQFSVSRLSFPFVRGVGSGRNSPAVTTYIDDVPQLTFATSNIELVDLERMEFLRGPQGTLYGRNTLGGVINIYSRQPTNRWEFDSTTTLGSYDLQDYRLSLKGPIVPGEVYVAASGGYLARDGYSRNDVTGDRIDDKDHLFGRFELRFTPSERWDIRVTVNGEQDRDGDYALYDLASIIARPRHVAHDFQGFSDRDVSQIAATAHYAGDAFDFVSISALQHWRSQDVTDLDETALDLIRRNNKESQDAYVQEFRLSSPVKRPIDLGNDLKLRWIGGAFFFTSHQNQFATNDFRPGAVGVIPQLFFPFKQSDTADLGDYGVSVYGQGTLTLHERLEFTAGVRYDYQHSQADLASFSNSQFVPGSSLRASDNFDQITPRFELGYHWNKDLYTYTSAAKGFKAGGFNEQGPAGSESFGDETSWTYEAGVKANLLDGRLRLSADYYYIDWDNLQLDTPTASPGVFFIENSGHATSHGLEFQADLIVLDDLRGAGTLDLFGGAGIINSSFGAGSNNQGADIGGNALPFAPDFTANVGAQYAHSFIGNTRAYVRAEIFSVGKYAYDASNAASQDTYTLASFRVGVGGQTDHVAWRLEAFLNNAFNAKYVPLAFPFSFARSGYVGESGDPQTAGVTMGLSF